MKTTAPYGTGSSGSGSDDDGSGGNDNGGHGSEDLTNGWEMKSSAMRAFQDVTASAQWASNLLWLTIASVTSSFFIGQIGLLGYGAELIANRCGRPEVPNVDIEPERLGDYFSKGIWPFLASFLTQTVASFLIFGPMGFLFGILGEATNGQGGPLTLFVIVLLIAVFAALWAVVFLIATPLIIRGMVCQDFSLTFDFGWAVRFSKLILKDLIVSGILFGILSSIVGFIGVLFCFIGVFPAMGIVQGAYVNLLAQWYEVYLSRGGEPAPPAKVKEPIIDATIVG